MEVDAVSRKGKGKDKSGKGKKGGKKGKEIHSGKGYGETTTEHSRFDGECRNCGKYVRLACVTLVPAVFVLCFLSSWSLVCSAHLLRLLMEAYHLGAPGAESQRFSARCICSFHCSWLAAHFLPSLSGGLCSRLPHVPW